ncbi:MAG: gamma-glutamyltransferase [Polyangiaceae bacterium]|nr:gamma-glutamyltransferase [Polyangiaceae bacterium]
MSRLLLVLLSLLLGCACAKPEATEARSKEPARERRPSAAPAAASAAGADAAATTDAAPAAAELVIAPGPAIAMRAGGRRVVTSSRGLVVSVEALATRAGVTVLEAGGNAMDAAIAAAYALAVTHPSAGNIGGGGFMLVHRPGQPPVAIDFRETAPGGLSRERFREMIAQGGVGPLSVGVPGTVAGLELGRERFATLPRERLLAPAIELAKKGHRIGEREALTFRWNWKGLSKDPVAATTFGDGKRPKAAGAVLHRPHLARTLESIAQRGRDGFYSGDVAEHIERALGGAITRRDLAAYRALERTPLNVQYRGHELFIMPPPSAGGVAVALILRQMAAARAWEQPHGSAPYLHLFIEASRRAQARRRFDVVSPDGLDSERAQLLAARWQSPQDLLARAPIEPERATPSERVHPLWQAAVREAEHTTHLSVIDGQGMAVSLTTTLSAGFGAKLVVPQTGIVLNNSAASFASAGDNLPEPGRRTTSSMAPTLVQRDGQLVAVLGSPGGDTIPSTVAQVFLALVDGQKTLDDAVDAPRVHHGFFPDEVRYERARSPDKPTLDALVGYGHTLSKKTIPIGDANNIVVAGRIAHGYSDPREGGRAQAPRRGP